MHMIVLTTKIQLFVDLKVYMSARMHKIALKTKVQDFFIVCFALIVFVVQIIQTNV